MNWVWIQLFAASTLIAFGVLVGFVCRKFLSEPVSTEGRLKHLEGVRALAALAVVACHVTQHIVLNLGFAGRPEFSDRLGIIGVQMFFGLTAFLFTRRILSNTLDVSTFFLGRIRRLVPLYLAVCVAAIALVQLHHPLVQSWKQTGNEIYAVLLYGFMGASELKLQGHNMLGLIGAAWTLHYEWCFYLLVPVLVLFVRTTVGIVVALTICLLGMAHDFSITPEVVWPFFLPGVLAAFAEKYLPVLSLALEKSLGYVAIMLLIISVALPGFFSFSHVIVSTLLFLCVFLSKPRILQGETLQYLAQISYSIYLLQYLIITPVMGLGSHPGIFATHLAMVLYSLLVMLILVPFSHVTYRLIELPWMRASYPFFSFRKLQA